TPKRLRRLIQERLGSAPSRLEGRFLSQPRTRHSSVLVRHPNSGGHITPQSLPKSFCCFRRRPSISATRSSGRPNSWRACSKTLAACCAWRRSHARRSWAVRRRRWRAFTCFLTDRVVGDIVDSWMRCGSVAIAVFPGACGTYSPRICESGVTAPSWAPRTSCFLLSTRGGIEPDGFAPRFCQPMSHLPLSFLPLL